jgi:hypothetical protein
VSERPETMSVPIQPEVETEDTPDTMSIVTDDPGETPDTMSVPTGGPIAEDPPHTMSVPVDLPDDVEGA